MQTKLFSNLAGELTGAPDRRPPLVLLHGLTFDRTMWRPALAHHAELNPGRQVLLGKVTARPGSGHFPHLARPAEFAGLLAATGGGDPGQTCQRLRPPGAGS